MTEPAEPYCYTVDEIAAMWKCSRQHVHAKIARAALNTSEDN